MLIGDDITLLIIESAREYFPFLKEGNDDLYRQIALFNKGNVELYM